MLLQGEGGETPTDVENKIYFVVVKCPVHRIVLYIAFTTGHMGPGMLRKSNSVDDKRGLGLETVYLRLKFFRKTDTYFFFFFYRHRASTRRRFERVYSPDIVSAVCAMPIDRATMTRLSNEHAH